MTFYQGLKISPVGAYLLDSAQNKLKNAFKDEQALTI